MEEGGATSCSSVQQSAADLIAYVRSDSEGMACKTGDNWKDDGSAEDGDDRRMVAQAFWVVKDESRGRHCLHSGWQ